MLKLPLPSKEPEPVTEPVILIVLAVANLDAVAAFPENYPACKVTVEYYLCPSPK